MKQYEYQSLSMTAWERSYEQLGMDGWVPVYVPSPRVWLMREIVPEIETRELLRGVYEEPSLETLTVKDRTAFVQALVDTQNA